MRIAGPFLALTLLSVSLVGCKPGGGDAKATRVEEGNRSGILHRGNGSEPDSLDPQLATSVSSGNILLNLFEGLVRQNPKDLSAEPGMASHWEVSEDGRTYTFHLRSDARWTDGTALTAKDFEFAYQRMLHPVFGAAYAYMLYPLKGATAYHKGEVDQLEGVRAIDEKTLRIELELPVPYFLSLLNHWTWFPLPEHVVRKNGDWLSRDNQWSRPANIVSNGSFAFKEWAPAQSITLEKNPDYWDAASVSLNGVVFHVFSDAASEERAFRTGGLHVTYKIPLSKVAVYRKERPEVLRIDPYLESVFYAINVKREALSDKRVRQALVLAVDRRLLTDKVLSGEREPALTFVPAGAGGYTGPAPIEESVERARALLVEAGYPNGEGFPEIEMIFRKSSSGNDTTRVAEVLQQQWKHNLGITVRLQAVEKNSYFSRRREHKFDLCYFGWVGDYLDPTTFLDLFQTDGGNNASDWSSVEYDEALAAAAAATDQEKRHALLRRAEAVLLEESPLIPLYFGTTKYLVDPSVKGWYPTLLDHHPLRAVDLVAKEPVTP